MGLLVPPPLDHPDFEKIMERRIQSNKIRLYVLFGMTLLAIVFMAIVLGR